MRKNSLLSVKNVSITHISSKTNHYLDLSARDIKHDFIDDYEKYERKRSYGSWGGYGHGMYAGQFPESYYNDWATNGRLPFDDDDDYYNDYYNNSYDDIPRYKNKNKRNNKSSNGFNGSSRNTKRSMRHAAKFKGIDEDESVYETCEKWIYFYEDYENLHNMKEFHTLKEFKEYLDENGINLSSVEEELIRYWKVSHVSLNPSDKADGILSVVAASSQSKLYETCADIEYSRQMQASKSDLPF